MELPEIPVNKDITYLGLSTYRDRNQLFGIKRKDRRQHVYVLGKSGTGKSALLFNMIIQNIQNGEGVCMVDPHGENVESVLHAIPRHRIKDVIYFNPADTEYHIGFNVLELVDPQYKHLVASGLMGIFTKIWANAWSARMEYILNNTILALLDTPGTTLLGIPRMLVDKDYRQKIISNLKDPVIKAFWVHEYEAWQDKFRNEAIAPIQNKVGQFLSTSIIRNVVGQAKSTINIFDMMNEGKIFLVNVSKGRIGEDNSALLGGMIITKIQLAAMERVRIPEDDRKDFYLYVDEFQNFVTDAFAGILSEARKYRLNLTVAHQYTAQLISDKSSAVRDAVFGNVGTMIVFRVGAEDAEFLEKEFEPEFTPQDIVNLPNYKVYMKLMIDGITSRPFSAKTLPPLVKANDRSIADEVINMSRELYCRPRDVIEKEIADWSGMSLGDGSSSGSGVTAGAGEKFPIICSLCGQERTVPFKPEPGRPAYCKECMAKIKDGSVKVPKMPKMPRINDEAEYFRPLADMGIEFSAQSGSAAGGKVPHNFHEKPQNHSASKPSFMGTIKKVFDVKPGHHQPKDHAGLKEALSKVMHEKPRAIPESKQPEPISLESLKHKMQDIKKSPAQGWSAAGAKDRAATPAEMNKLKDLIQAAAPSKVPQTEVLQKATAPDGVPQIAVTHQIETPPPQNIPTAQPAQTSIPQKPPEVPEDVLKKILE